ncbi:MAG TPA: hypothetical protein VN804_01545 [Solirubrobacteraceae bacterium]|nr:hypothetical protein [Solirubrobacteraceae bacterium]
MLGIAICLNLGIPQRAGAEPYGAAFVNACCNETIESGAVERQSFTLMNIGTETWGAPGTFSINLGSINFNAVAYSEAEPRERFSTFAAPDWPSPTRASVGVSHLVPPGGEYKFTFDVKAPTVSQQAIFQEFFALVAEGDVWLDNLAGDAPGPEMPLVYTVLPAHPPTVSASLSKTTVTSGESFTVNASATAVVSLNHITIQFAGQQVSSGPPRSPEVADDIQESWNTSPTLSTAGLGSGPQTVVVTAYDDAGLSSTTTATVNVQSPAPPPPPPPPPPKPLVLGVPRMYFAGSTLSGDSNRLRLTRVVVLGTTAGERVFASCHHCRGKSKLGPLVAEGGQVTFHPRRLTVTGHSKLIVYATRPGYDGRYKVYAINVGEGSAKAKQQGCLAPGGTAHTPCPG